MRMILVQLCTQLMAAALDSATDLELVLQDKKCIGQNEMTLWEMT